MKKALLVVLGVLLLWHVYVLLPVFAEPRLDIGQLKVQDRHGQLITHLSQPDGLQMLISDDEPLPEMLVSALLTIEDERFYDHWGSDAIAKLRALRDNLWAQQVVSGGSTLTEQLLKNRYFPESRRTILQKAREATLAFYASLVWDKDQVLREYLNRVYFGHRNYGLKAAMLSYFDKTHLETLTQAEIVTLLAILRSPGVIDTSEEYFQGRFQRIADQLGWEVEIPEMSLGAFQGLNRFPHVTATVRQLSSESEVQVTIDAELQEQARQLIDQSLKRLAGKNVTNGAVYAMRPSTGEILVWQGSKDFHARDIDGQVNVITQRRQMGSALKPFIYLFAFAQGAHPDQLIVDLEKDFQTDKEDELYRPLNYSLREGGVMPLKMALANSFNIASVRLLEYLGLQQTYAFMKNIGIPFDFPAEHYGLSLALGSPDLPMKAVADSYAGLARGGSPVTGSLFKQEVAAPEDLSVPLFHLWSTLSNPLNRRRSFGANSILNSSIPFAVKTGTTKNFHDNWTFGYHPDLVVASWVGNNDNTPMSDVDGITGAGPIWNRVVEAAIEAGYVSTAHSPQVPEELTQATKCLDVDCRQSELVYQEPGQRWHSDLATGDFCLEDFFISKIDTAEITKVAKLFDFEDFHIHWCLRDDSSSSDTPTVDIIAPEILKPQAGEVFYLREDIPLELQEIILKSTVEGEWRLNGGRVGYGKIFFIQPELGKHEIEFEFEDQNLRTQFEVRGHGNG